MRTIIASRLYPLIILTSLIILISVLIHLSYNTFALYDQQYQNTEKLLIKQAYTRSITNDKLFPGGEKIIDSYIMSNIFDMDSLHLYDCVKLERTRDSLFSKMIVELRDKNTMDSLFIKIKEEYELGVEWEYALVLNHIEINFSNNRRFVFYSSDQDNKENSNHNLPNYSTARIGGKLTHIRPQNLVSELTVSSPKDYTYEARFSLFADRSDRKIIILKHILPIVLFGLICIVAVVIVYILTYKNWRRQKRLTEMKSDFINSITHEFHTPISTILVATKTLKNTETKTITQSLTDVIERQTVRVQSLFSQVLDITSMSGEKLQRENVELNTLLSEIIHDYKLKIKEKNIDLQFNRSNDVHIDLNPFFFTTMVSNLLDNAIKHNKKVLKNVTVSINDLDKNIKITFSDNGEGISNKETIHIFEKFYRSKDSNVSGLGLGLYYVKQCVLVHGWTMHVESRKGVGSYFILSILKK